MPAGSAMSGISAGSQRNTTARTPRAMSGAIVAIRAAKLVSTNSTLSAASLTMKPISAAPSLGLMVWQIACMPETA